MGMTPAQAAVFARALKRGREIQEAERCEASLYEFVKAAWHVFDPAEFVGNWHLEDICEHLEAVARGNIPRLLINEPPRTGKTALVSICFPAWVWAQREKGPLMGPQVSFYYASYAEQLSLEHSLKCRRLIESRWYQRLWGSRFKLVSDRNTKGHFENDKGGYRMASSVDARATGFGADILCLPKDEHILTSSGWLPIGKIVGEKLDVEVAGYDHATGCVVWQRILEHEQNPGRPLVAVTFDGGSFRCTDDHPVFVEGRGYVPAGSVRVGDRLILCDLSGPALFRETQGEQQGDVLGAMLCGTTAAQDRGEYHAMQGMRRPGLRDASTPTPWQWAVLLKGLFRKGRSRREKSSVAWRKGYEELQALRCRVSLRSGAIGATAILQPFVHFSFGMGSARSDAVAKLRGVRAAVQAWRSGRQEGQILLQGMQGPGACQRDAGPGQSALRPRRISAAIRAWLDKGAQAIRSLSGWLHVPRLQPAGIGAWDGVARAPHQLRQERHGARQPDFSLSRLPRSDARDARPAQGVATAVVRSIERAGYAEHTYNLNVSPCHNYFAGGALLHNCADDPHLVKEAESDLVREGVVRWWSETMPSRMNDRRTGAMVVVMQRVHEGDLSGHILANDLGYVHICVPLCYVPCFHVNAWVGDRIETIIGEEDVAEIADEDVFWTDPRTEEGELLWPARLPASEVAKIEKEVGPYGFAGQYQQEPAPRGGGIIRAEWWQQYNDDVGADAGAKPGQYPPCEYILASLDTAYTEKEENDYSALSIWGIWRDKNGNPQIILMLCWQERLQIHELVSRVGADCKTFTVDRLIIEDKAAGHSVSQELARLFGTFDFGIELVNPRTGFIKSPDKVARLQTVVHLFAEGLVWAPDKAWADEMIKQCALVPRALHDDLADSMSQALIYLRRAGWAQRKEERAIEVEDELRYRPRSGALYPV